MGIPIASHGILVNGWVECLKSSRSWIHCGVDHTKICEEEYKNLVVEFLLVEHVQFVFVLWVKFSNGIVVERVVTYRQFWRGQHEPLFLDLPLRRRRRRRRHHHLHY